MNQFETLARLYCDHASWVDVKHYPSTVNCRLILALVDFAAADPGRWGTTRLAFEVPELSYREIAAIRRLSHTAVMHQLAPRPVCSENVPSTSGVKYEHTCASLTYRNAVALCTFATALPVRWQVIRLAYACPELSQRDIARVLRISQQCVSKYLRPVRLTADVSTVEYLEV